MRAHTGGPAERASATLGARAFAIGDQVAFGTAPDLHTAAHEAAHVVQQRESVALKGAIDTPGDAFEIHADAVADAVVSGRSAEPLLDRMPGLGGAAATTPGTVQRDTSKGAKAAPKDPADLPPPPPGEFVVEITTDGGYQFWFNTTDVKKWSNPLFTAMKYYMNRVFPGASDAVIQAAINATKAGFVDKDQDPHSWPDNVRYRLGVLPALHQSVKIWMHQHHRSIAPHEIKPGKGGLGGGGEGDSNGKGTEPSGTRTTDHRGQHRSEPAKASTDELQGPKQSAEDVERARAIYERLRRAFPDSDAWQSDTAPYPEFLAFLADHAGELANLPKGKHGAKAATVDQLKQLLEAFENHQLANEASPGTADGHDDGAADGSPQGAKNGSKAVKTPGGTEGGSKYGEKDGSKYGWIKWEPKGEIVVRPKLDKYVAGSSIKVEIKWDFSVHPESSSILLPNHCSYVWKTRQNGKTVDSDGNSIFADDRHTSLDLGGKGGETELEVTAKSRHFKDKKKFQQKVVLVVVKEADFDKATFDDKQVGADKTFSRDNNGKLHTNPDQKILSVDDEINATDLASGGIRELAKQGKISESDRETLIEQATNQRAALKEIQDKVKNGTPYLVRGTFVSREDSSTTELKLMMHVLQQKTERGIAFYNLILHDLTMGDGTQHPGMAFQFLDHERPASVFHMLEGEALEAMADHFHAHNDYPKGTIHLAAQRLTSGDVWERTLDTNNWRKKTKKALGTVVMIGGVALLVVPGGGALAVGLMIVSGAAGATSIALEIEDRVEKEGTLKFDRRLVLDLLQLASTVLSFGALSTALREASMVAKSRYMLSMVGIDAAQGFVIAVDTRDALRKIDAETAVKLAAAKTDEERKLILSERDRQVAEIIGGAVVSGGFLLVSLGGGIKQVMATTRAGKQFAVREPAKALAERSAAEIQDALANQRFIHDNRAVVLTEAESQFLEAQLMQLRIKAPAGDPATAPAPGPEPKGNPEDHKPPHERTTDRMPAVDPEGRAPSEDHKPPHERTTAKMPAADAEGKAPSEDHLPPHERTTAKMPAVDPTKVPSQEATRVTFEGKGDTIGARAAKVAPEPGYFDVVVHGDPHSFWVLHNGSWVPVKPNSVRKWLSRQPGYHGQKIRLISCEAGAAGDGVAQAMANGMGVEVKAPTETLWVHDDGRMTIGADSTQPSTGTWRDFSPAKVAKAAPATPATLPEPTPRTDEPGKVGATEPHEPLPHDDGVAPDLDSSTSAPKEPTAPQGDGPAPLGKQPHATAGDTATESLPTRKKSGEFADPELEKQYQDYRKRKHAAEEHPRGRKAWKERVAWWMQHSPVARGNRYNRSVAKRRLYTYNEVHLEDGTRLDSYEHNGAPERISRKATDFLAISDAEFKGYLSEIEAKYPKGKKIRSNKYPELDGKRLRGEAVLEVPLENLDPKDPKFADPALRTKLDETRARFEQLADDAGVELRYTAE